MYDTVFVLEKILLNLKLPLLQNNCFCCFSFFFFHAGNPSNCAWDIPKTPSNSSAWRYFSRFAPSASLGRVCFGDSSAYDTFFSYGRKSFAGVLSGRAGRAGLAFAFPPRSGRSGRAGRPGRSAARSGRSGRAGRAGFPVPVLSPSGVARCLSGRSGRRGLAGLAGAATVTLAVTAGTACRAILAGLGGLYGLTFGVGSGSPIGVSGINFFAPPPPIRAGRAGFAAGGFRLCGGAFLEGLDTASTN